MRGTQSTAKPGGAERHIHNTLWINLYVLRITS